MVLVCGSLSTDDVERFSVCVSAARIVKNSEGLECVPSLPAACRPASVEDAGRDCWVRDKGLHCPRDVRTGLVFTDPGGQCHSYAARAQGAPSHSGGRGASRTARCWPRTCCTAADAPSAPGRGLSLRRRFEVKICTKGSHRDVRGTPTSTFCW